VRRRANVWLRHEHPELDERLRDVEIEVSGGLVLDLLREGRRWRFSHREVVQAGEGGLMRWLVFEDKGPEQE
jgi:hypothetical protein